MSDYNKTIKEILKGIKYMVDDAVSSTTKVYDGIVMSYDKNSKWNIQYNGEVHSIKLYGSIAPKIKSIVKVFIPQGNQSLAWFMPFNSSDKEFYPVGSIYLSTNEISPAEIFGGTWEKIKGKFLFGSGENYSLGNTGGNLSHKHGLNSGFADVMIGSKGLRIRETVPHKFTPSDKATVTEYTTDEGTSDWAAQLSGTTDLESNMPPYLVINIWKRVE